MDSLLDGLLLWGIRLLVAIGLIASLYQVAIRPTIFLARTAPRVGVEAQPWREWLARREWIVVFVLGNALVFALSLYFVDQLKGSSAIEIVLENSLVTSQVGCLLLAAGLIVCDPEVGRHAVKAPTAEFRYVWVLALTLALLANALALVDSLRTGLHHGIGPIHFAVWLVQNVGCMLFFGVLLWRMLRRDYAYVSSTRVLWIWWIALALISASIADGLLPVDR